MNFLRGHPFHGRPGTGEFGGVWHWHVTEDSSLPIGNNRGLFRLVAEVLRAIKPVPEPLFGAGVPAGPRGVAKEQPGTKRPAG